MRDRAGGQEEIGNEPSLEGEGGAQRRNDRDKDRESSEDRMTKTETGSEPKGKGDKVPEKNRQTEIGGLMSLNENDMDWEWSEGAS